MLVYVVLAVVVAGLIGVLTERIDRLDRAVDANRAALVGMRLLGPYPTQRVLSRVEGVDGPAVRVGEALLVEGTKCGGDVAVEVEVEIAWQPVEPRGLPAGAATGITVRESGCETRQYVNVVPDEVVDQSLATFATTGIPARWQLAGVETPYLDGVVGQRRRWVTQTFAVVP